MRLFIFFTFFSVYISFAQNFIITYKEVETKERINRVSKLNPLNDPNRKPIETLSTLFLNRNESFYSTKADGKVFNSLSEIEVAGANEEGNVELNFGIGSEFFTYKNTEKKYYYEKAALMFNSVVIQDKIPKFNWIIINDTSLIGTYKCRKATANYRNQIYTAWFTDEISISNGPKEFGGLPGLILKIETRDFITSAIKIEKKNNSIPQIFSETNQRDSKTLTLDQFNEKDLLLIKKLEEASKSGTLMLGKDDF